MTPLLERKCVRKVIDNPSIDNETKEQFLKIADRYLLGPEPHERAFTIDEWISLIKQLAHLAIPLANYCNTVYAANSYSHVKDKISGWENWWTECNKNVRLQLRDFSSDVIIFENGGYDILKKTFVPGIPNKSWRKMGCPYNPMAKINEHSAWRLYLSRAFSKDTGMIDYIQRLFASCLIDDPSNLFFQLRSTSSGYRKIMIDVLLALMGTYAETGTGYLTKSSESTKRKISKEIENARVYVEEDGLGMIDSKYITLLSDGRYMPINDTNKNYVTSKSTAKIWFEGSAYPRIKKPTDDIIERFCVIKIDKGEDHDLERRIILTELPSIANWAIVGIEKLRSNPLTNLPYPVKRERELWKKSINPMIDFNKFCEELFPNVNTGISGGKIYTWEQIELALDQYEDKKKVRKTHKSNLRVLILLAKKQGVPFINKRPEFITIY